MTEPTGPVPFETPWAVRAVLALCLITLALGVPGFAPVVASAMLTLLLLTGSVLALQPRDGGAHRTLGGSDILALLLIFTVAAVLRLGALETHPPLPDIDEELNGQIVMDILEGQGPGTVLTHYSSLGEEAASFYLQALVFQALGPGLMAFRALSALAGSMAVVVLYLFLRLKTGVAPAAIASLLFAFNLCHVMISRMGNSFSLAVLAQLLAFLALSTALRRRRIRDHALLGVLLGLGLNTYPIFRLVPAIVFLVIILARVADGTWRQPSAWIGPVVVALLVFLALAPILFTPTVLGEYLGRLVQMTLIGREPGQWGAEVLTRFSRVGAIWTGLGDLYQDFRLFPSIVPPLSLLGLVVLWYRRRTGSSFEFAAAAMLVSGLLPPLLVSFEAESARRYILLLGPAYLLLGLALANLSCLLPPVVRENRLMKVLITAAMGALMFTTLRSAVPWLNPVPCEVSTERMAVALALAPERPVIVTRRSLPRPALVDAGMMPLRGLFERGFGIHVAEGLNPYPTFPPREEPLYVLGSPRWTDLLIPVHSGGQPVMMRDPRTGDPHMFFQVPGLEAWNHQGVTCRGFGAGRKLLIEEQLGSVDFPDREVAGVTRWEWSGAIYLPEQGSWVLSALGLGQMSLSVGQSSVPLTPSGAILRGEFGEGWHPFRLQFERGSLNPVAPQLLWALQPSQRDREIPRWNLIRQVPDAPALLASKVSRDPLRLVVRSARYWPNAHLDGLQQDLIALDDGILALTSGPNSFRYMSSDGARLPARSRFRASGGSRLRLAMSSDYKGWAWSIDFGTDGTAVLLDAARSRLLLLDREGTETGQIDLAEESRRIEGMAMDPAGRRVILSSPETLELLQVDLHGGPLSSREIEGVFGFCFSADGRRLFAAQPYRGGVAVLDSESGRELDFWRATEVTPLTRLASDEENRVALLVSGGRMMVFDSEGLVLMPPTTLPTWNVGPQGDLPPFYCAVNSLGAGEWLLGLTGGLGGFVRVLTAPEAVASRAALPDVREVIHDWRSPE